MDDWLEAAYDDRQSGTDWEETLDCADAEDLHDIVSANHPGWDASSYGDTLICPCGEELELDAPRCSCGQANPLVARGYI